MIQIIHHLHSINSPIPNTTQADLIFADPPYNIGISYADDLTKDAQPEKDYFDWCESVIKNGLKQMKPNGTFWWLCPENHGDTIGSLLKSEIGPRVGRIIWHEPFAQYQQKSLTKDYRMLFCHTNGDPNKIKFYPDRIREPSVRQQMGDKRADPRGRVPGSVWKVRRLQGTSKDRVKWHPCQLPPELLKRIILGWTDVGDYCIDLFAGSGNFGKICSDTNRNAILIEGSQTYVAELKKLFNQSKLS